MTNTIALWLGGIILAVVAADLLYFHWDLHLIVGWYLLRVLEWVAFWR